MVSQIADTTKVGIEPGPVQYDHYTHQQVPSAPAEAPVPCVQHQLPFVPTQEGLPGMHHLSLAPGAEQHCTTLLQRTQEGVLGHLGVP